LSHEQADQGLAAAGIHLDYGIRRLPLAVPLPQRGGLWTPQVLGGRSMRKEIENLLRICLLASSGRPQADLRRVKCR